MQMTLNGAREHSLYKVCEEHFAGKIGKCSGSLNNENLHFHFGKKPEAPPSCFVLSARLVTSLLRSVKPASLRSVRPPFLHLGDMVEKLLIHHRNWNLIRHA